MLYPFIYLNMHAYLLCPQNYLLCFLRRISVLHSNMCDWVELCRYRETHTQSQCILLYWKGMFSPPGSLRGSFP